MNIKRFLTVEVELPEGKRLWGDSELVWARLKKLFKDRADITIHEDRACDPTIIRFKFKSNEMTTNAELRRIVTSVLPPT
jgi:hypothetical protein